MLSDECIEDEIPFEIPESWEWVRLGSVAEIQLGKMLDKQKNEGVPKPYLANANVQWGQFALSDVRTMPFRNEELGKFKLRPGDLMICEGGVPGRCAIWDSNEEMYYQKALHRIRCDSSVLLVRYCCLVINLLVNSHALDDDFTGTTIKHLPARILERWKLPLPPVAEQYRILDRTKRLIVLVDEYDALESARQQLDAELPDRLRKSILQQAVQGRLAPQDPADEPASVLLGRIREERRRLIAEGRLKAPKGGESVIYRASDGSYYEKRVDAKGRGGEPVCIDDEIPFEIPDSWEWVRISSIGEVVGGGTPKTHDASLWGCKEHGIAWVTPADMKHVKGIYVEAGERYISDEGLSSSSARLLPIGSVLMSSRAPIGYVAIASAPIATNQGFKSIVPYIAGMSLWLYWVIQSRMDNIKERATGTTFKEISGNEFGMTLIPLPPCKEQFDICSSIKKLLEIATNQ